MSCVPSEDFDDFKRPFAEICGKIGLRVGKIVLLFVTMMVAITWTTSLGSAQEPAPGAPSQSPSDPAATPPASGQEEASAETEGENSQSSTSGETAFDEMRRITEADSWEEAWSSGKVLLFRFGLPALFALLLIIVAYFVASFISRVASRPVRSRVDETLGRFVDKLVFYLIMLATVLGVLQYFGIGVSSFAAVLAAAGFAIGLAFQGTLSNFAAGVMLLVFRPFKVGHVISAAGITAKVYEIDLFHTVFDTFDNRRIIVPNSEIFAGTIENISYHVERRVDVAVGVDYGADIRQTREVLEQAAMSLQDLMIEGEDRGFQIVLGDLGDSAVSWTVRFWTHTDNFWSAKEALTEAIKVHLDQAGIGIPYPQMDVHLFKQNG